MDIDHVKHKVDREQNNQTWQPAQSLFSTVE